MCLYIFFESLPNKKWFFRKLWCTCTVPMWNNNMHSKYWFNMLCYYWWWFLSKK